MSVPLHRHVNGLVGNFAAEHGELDLISRRVDCSADAYEGILETFERFGIIGGAGIRVRRDDRLLVVQYTGSDGWVDPGDHRHLGETYRECAKRSVTEATGIEATIDGLSQIHLIYMDDWTDREPIPNPYLSFHGRYRSGTTRSGRGVRSVQWMSDLSDEVLLYNELKEHPLGE